jgi:mono/diheme cytochrome c family protein
MLAAPSTGGAQQAGPDSARTTHSGVYSLTQAMRGKDTYAGMCASCHTVASHTGATFGAAWNGRPLADLYGYIRNAMPKNEPGILSPEEYAQVLAYLLKMNGMPAGSGELPADSTVMRKIRIEMGAKRPGGP